MTKLKKQLIAYSSIPAPKGINGLGFVIINNDWRKPSKKVANIEFKAKITPKKKESSAFLNRPQIMHKDVEVA